MKSNLFLLCFEIALVLGGVHVLISPEKSDEFIVDREKSTRIDEICDRLFIALWALRGLAGLYLAFRGKTRRQRLQMEKISQTYIICNLLLFFATNLHLIGFGPQCEPSPSSPSISSSSSSCSLRHFLVFLVCVSWAYLLLPIVALFIVSCLLPNISSTLPRAALLLSRSKPPVGISEKELASLLTVPFKRGLIDQENAVCSICLEPFEENSLLRWLPCNHYFHKDCADEWLQRNAVCPLCKESLIQPKDMIDTNSIITDDSNDSNDEDEMWTMI